MRSHDQSGGCFLYESTQEAELPSGPSPLSGSRMAFSRSRQVQSVNLFVLAQLDGKRTWMETGLNSSGGPGPPTATAEPLEIKTRRSASLQQPEQSALLNGCEALVLHQRLAFDVSRSLFSSSCSESHFRWCHWRWSTGSRSQHGSVCRQAGRRKQPANSRRFH